MTVFVGANVRKVVCKKKRKKRKRCAKVRKSAQNAKSVQKSARIIKKYEKIILAYGFGNTR